MKDFHVDFSVRCEKDSFRAKNRLLKLDIFTSSQRTICLDNSMPRQTIGALFQCPSYSSCLLRIPQKTRYLAIGSYLGIGNLSNHLIDRFKKGIHTQPSCKAF